MTDLEQRLRQALAARAVGVTAQALRPIGSERHGSRVRWWLPLSTGLAAAAVVMLIFVVFHRPPSREHPIAPAGSVPASRPTRSAPISSAPSTARPASSGPTGSGPTGSGPTGSGPGISGAASQVASAVPSLSASQRIAQVGR
jgi:hypothetical protein